jgi:hypothetical protein
MVFPKRGITMQKTAFGYIRVSTDEQADSGLGVEAQRQRIRAYCELKGLHLAETGYRPVTKWGVWSLRCGSQI